MSEFGVYVHVPFCAHRCDYCAFATYDDKDQLMTEYVDAVVREIAVAVGEGLAPATSVFFGGGTPSRLPADALLTILEAIPLVDEAEVTVECNPEDASIERLATYRRGGVTRMSFGVQSTRPAVLADLGRRHGAMQHVAAARAAAEAGFDTWNMDLIVGSRRETPADAQQSVEDLITLDIPPPHVSCYALTAEPGTPLGRDLSRHPDEDQTADAYALVTGRLEEAGYLFEEISNFARPGHGCRHNQLYWSQGDYRGFGSAAHSHVRSSRSWNVRTPERYIEMVRAGQSPRGGFEELDEPTQTFERESLALRTTRGVTVDAFDDLDEIAHLIDVRDGIVRLAPAGRLLANQVILRLRSAAAAGDTSTISG
jgi:oxygen-independent coproporphyrinogen-3 oxidase